MLMSTALRGLRWNGLLSGDVYLIRHAYFHAQAWIKRQLMFIAKERWKACY